MLNNGRWLQNIIEYSYYGLVDMWGENKILFNENIKL